MTPGNDQPPQVIPAQTRPQSLDLAALVALLTEIILTIDLSNPKGASQYEQA